MVFPTQANGFVVAVGNFHFGGETSVIRETTDGGATWRTVWTGLDMTLSWIGQAGTRLVATGARSPQTQAGNASLLGNGQVAQTPPVLVSSSDGGRSWTITNPIVPASAQQEAVVGDFASSSVGLEVPDVTVEQYAFLSPREPLQLLRTTNGGASWAAVELPGGSPTGGASFVNLTTGFVTGSPTVSDPACIGELWKTVDAGRTWTAVQASCVPFPLFGVAFPTSAVGYAVGGVLERDPQRAVIATGDGGNSWTVRFTGHDPEFNSLGFFSVPAFPTVNDGYVLQAGCKYGEEDSCGGQLWATTNAGASWTPTDISGARLSVPSPGHVHVVGGFA